MCVELCAEPVSNPLPLHFPFTPSYHHTSDAEKRIIVCYAGCDRVSFDNRAMTSDVLELQPYLNGHRVKIAEVSEKKNHTRVNLRHLSSI